MDVFIIELRMPRTVTKIFLIEFGFLIRFPYQPENQARFTADQSASLPNGFA